MTDNEIIKALECCLSQEYISDCEKCQYFAIDCRDKLIEQALALINRQKEEIERLKSMNQAKLDTIHDLRAEIEKIKAKLKYYLETNEENGVVYIPKFVINNLVKEMVGDNND